jgi:CoA:oxalate CoA-transferase
MASGALDGIRILDFSQGKAGPYCTKLLADFGADVVKVERPDGGDWGRRLPPLLADGDEPERSALFAFLNTNKRSLALDLKDEAGRETARRLVREVDVVVESFRPGTMARLGLGYDDLVALNPALVLTSVSNWGQDSPYRDAPTTDLIAWAASGALYSGGLPGREPLKVGSSLAHFSAGVLAAVATLGALYGADETGQGQHVDVSLIDGIAQLLSHWDINMAAFRGAPPSRLHRPQGGPVLCKDGYIGVNFYGGSPHHWSSFCAMSGMIELLDDPRFATPQARLEHWDDLAAAIDPWLKERTKREVFEESLAWQLPFAYVASADELLTLDQHEARGFFVDTPVPSGGRLQMPGPPARLEDGGWALRRSAPRLGEHTADVLTE